MIETLVALFTAHVLADYVFQTNKMVERKKEPCTCSTTVSWYLAQPSCLQAPWARRLWC